MKPILICLIMLCIATIDARSCDEPHDDHDEEGRGCGGCKTYFYLTDASVGLGRFFTGSNVSLPVPSSEGNTLEFIFKGDARYYKTYNFSFSMDLIENLGPGTAQITEWHWQKADYSTNGVYGTASNQRTNPYNNVRLYKAGGYHHCYGIAKFRITAKRMVISPNATPANIQFNITVSATINM